MLLNVAVMQPCACPRFAAAIVTRTGGELMHQPAGISSLEVKINDRE
ncbi:hypothetical protein [Corynebacterium kefirresidentii]|nr:hypothetical protein [Corynebacterium kefirresidentii]MDN8633698.1 hypothetical protein [Corynebacterium kefirresidentii]